MMGGVMSGQTKEPGSLNLVELIELINAIPSHDKEMIKYYKRKLFELVDAINGDLSRIGFGPFTLNQLIELSPKPDLEVTQ